MGPHPSNLIQENAGPNVLSVVVVDHKGGPSILIQTLVCQVALRVELQGVVAVQQVPYCRVVLQDPSQDLYFCVWWLSTVCSS